MYMSFSLENSNGGFAEHLSWKSLWWLLFLVLSKGHGQRTIGKV